MCKRFSNVQLWIKIVSHWLRSSCWYWSNFHIIFRKIDTKKRQVKGNKRNYTDTTLTSRIVMIVMHNERGGIHVNIWEWSCHSCIIYVLPTINMSMLTYTMLHTKLQMATRKFSKTLVDHLTKYLKNFKKYAYTVLKTGHNLYP